jgi:bacterioferritin
MAMLRNQFENDVITIRDRLQHQIEQASSGGGTTLSPERALQVLQDVVAIEVLRYVRHIQTAMAAAAIDRSDLAVEFRDHAADELVHTMQAAERVSQLGGSTDFDAVSVIKRAHVAQAVTDQIDLVQLLKEDLAVERVVTSCCHQIGRRLDTRDVTTCRLIRSIGAEANGHVGGLTRLLKYVTGLDGGKTRT